MQNDNNHKNLAAAILENGGYSTDTSLTIPTITAATFPDVPFFATIMPTTDLANSNNSEIVEVTATSESGSDTTFTISRGQRGTTAMNWDAGKAVLVHAIYTEDVVYIDTTLSTPTNVAYVSEDNIQTSAVTTNKIADGAVTSQKIDWTTLSCATVFADNVSLTASAYKIIPFNATKNSDPHGRSYINGNITYDSGNNCLTIGQNISRVEVSGSFTVQNGTVGNDIWGVISLNDTVAGHRVASVSQQTQNGYNTMTFAPVILEVSNGDKIRMLVYTTSTGASVRGDNALTYLTVKQV